MYEYLRNHEMSRVVFDPFQPNFDESVFASGAEDSKEFYGDVVEELPLVMTKPLGKISHMTCFVAANHTGIVVTRRLNICALIYLVNALIIWLSKN